MTRTEALQKLLALGDLTQQQIESIMGGDRAEARDALEQSVEVRAVTYRHDGCGHRMYMLAPAARARAFWVAA